MKMRTDELILIAGIEGGGVSLRARQGPGGLRFKVKYSDATPATIGEEATQSEGEWLSGWPSVLDALDRHRWHRLPGVTVKREFRDRVWEAVEQRILSDREMPSHRVSHLLDRWRDRCGVVNQDVSLDP